MGRRILSAGIARNARVLVCLVAVFSSWAIQGAQGASAQAASAPLAHTSDRLDTRAPPVAIAADAVQTFTLTSDVRDTPYLIQVWAPEQAAPAEGWPVIYVLDGNSAFRSLIGAGAQGAQTNGVPAVIVGIGYEGAERYDMPARSYDYTPPSPGDASPVGSPRNPQATGMSLPGGGAQRFLSFLTQKIEPEIQARFATDPTQRTLFGHSYGGLFVLYAFFTAPDAFEHFVAASPSLWWNDRYIEQLATAFLSEPRQPHSTLALWVGENELAQSNTDRSVVSLARRLADNANIAVHSSVFPGLGHGPMSGAALAEALDAFRH